jgi:hypothetical protein
MSVPVFLIVVVVAFLLGMWAALPLYRLKLAWVIDRERELGNRERDCARREVEVEKVEKVWRGCSGL